MYGLVCFPHQMLCITLPCDTHRLHLFVCFLRRNNVCEIGNKFEELLFRYASQLLNIISGN